MVDNTPLSYFINPDRKSRDFKVLISRERTHKLELITHLMLNSRQALVICGQRGIGKSTFLNALQDRKQDSIIYSLINADRALSFENIQEQLAKTIKQHCKSTQATIALGYFSLLESQHKTLILLIDEAGQLAPEQINTLINYAAKNPALKLVFALTHEELEEKNSSDKELDHCHIIEIPPLTEQQSNDYAQHLMADSSDIADDITEEQLAHLYFDTNGIPGLIKAKLLKLDETEQQQKSLRILLAAVAGLVVIALATQWYSTSKCNLNLAPISASSIINNKIYIQVPLLSSSDPLTKPI